MLEKLRRDSIGMGVIMGIIVPAVMFGILYAVLVILQHHNPALPMKTLIPKVILISLIPSLFILRYYLLKLKYDRTGRGIVIATFALAIVFVIVQFTL